MTLATVLFLADVVVQLVPNELLYHQFCTLFKVLETFMQQHLHCRLQMHLPFEEKFNLEQDTSFENLLVIYLLQYSVTLRQVSLVFIYASTLIQYLNFDLKNNELNSSLVVSASDIEIPLKNHFNTQRLNSLPQSIQ